MKLNTSDCRRSIWLLVCIPGFRRSANESVLPLEIVHASTQTVDMLLVATEYKLRQVFACELFGIVYIIFNLLFFVFADEEDRVIYSVLDWEDPLSAILFAAGLVVILVPGFAIVFLGIYRCVRGCVLPSTTRVPSLPVMYERAESSCSHDESDGTTHTAEPPSERFGARLQSI